MSLIERDLSLPEAAQTIGSQLAAVQGQRYAVAGEGIDKSRRNAGQHHSSVFSLRLAKKQRRSSDRGKNRLPVAAALPERGMCRQQLLHGGSGISPHHG